MILRDPVHGLVAFEGDAEHVLVTLLATREVQRLRRVRQLGLTSLVFPGAEHSRFAHAVGTAHVMVRLLERIRALEGMLPKDERIDRETSNDAVAAALLHDLGHGPFSHLFEDVLPHARRHEAWTTEALLTPDTEVSRALEQLSRGMSGRVAALLTGDHPLGYLSRALSGMLDVDRCDYLLRDSHMTGVSYGLYDLDWLLRALSFGHVPGRTDRGAWVLSIDGEKGLPPIEGFFLSRNFMYQQVYHHKATRAAEALIRAIFTRVAELARDNAAPNGLPTALRAAALGEPTSLESYLALDDALLLTCFAQWEQASDEVLRTLVGRLRARSLPKTVALPEGQGAHAIWNDIAETARDIARKHGMRPDLTVWLDVADDIPYTEPDDDSPEGLWVSFPHRPICRASAISFLLRELKNKRIERPRLIVPAEIRDEVERALEEMVQ